MENPQRFFEQYSREVLQHEPEPIPPDPLFKQIEALAAKIEDRELREMIDDFRNNCVRYTETVLRTIIAYHRLGLDPEFYTEDIKRFEDLRKSSHDIVNDDLNIISRRLAKDGQDNTWRERFKHRDEISEWAQNIALGELTAMIEQEHAIAA